MADPIEGPLQATVGCVEGLHVQHLAQAIEAGYRTANGRAVHVTIGQGQFVDGLLPGLLLLTPVEPHA